MRLLTKISSNMNYPLLLLFLFVLLSAKKQGVAAPLVGKAFLDSLVKEAVYGRYKDNEDTNRVKLLCMISSKYRHTNADEGLRYGTMALNMAQKLNWAKGIGEAHFSLGLNYHVKSDIVKAIEYLKIALEVYKTQGDKRGVINTTNNIGSIKYHQGDLPGALEYLFSALTIAEELDDRGILGSICGNLSGIYSSLGNERKSLEYSIKSLAHAEASGKKTVIAHSFSSVGGRYHSIMQFDSAVYYYKQSLRIYQDLGNSEAIAQALFNIGLAHFRINRHGEGLECGTKSLKIYKEIGSKLGIANALSLIGDVYLSAARDSNLHTLGVAKIAERLKKNSPLGMDNRAALLRAADSTLSEALVKYLDLEMESRDELQSCYFSLSEAKALLGDYKGALENYKQHILLKDSVYSIATSVKIANLGAVRELELKDKQIELSRLAMEKKRNERYFYIAGLLMVLGVAGVSIRNMKLSTAKELSENKLSAFQARMNPHFIFNALSSIQSLIMNNENERSIDYLAEFSTLMRQVLDNSTKSKVLLKTEIDMLRSYIELEHLRFECFLWEIAVADDIDQETIEIPGMIIQPFVENAILHGLIPRGEGGLLKVEFTKNSKQIICTVEDNGIGREKSGELNKSRNRDRQSHGVNIATSRLALLNNKKAGVINKVTYTDKNENGLATGTLVTIQLPVL